MSAKVSLQRVIQLGLLQWEANTVYVMGKRGAWPWVVRCGGRLAIDVDALKKQNI
jgi:hypothetical protein